MINGTYKRADVTADGESFCINDWYRTHSFTFDDSLLKANSDQEIFEALCTSLFIRDESAKDPEGFEMEWLDDNILGFWYYPPKLRQAMQEENSEKTAWPCRPEYYEITLDTGA